MGDSTYSVETTGRVTIGLHLQSSIQSIGDVHAKEIPTKVNVRQAELAQAVDLEGLDEGDVEVIAGVAAEREQDLNRCLAVAHFQGDGERAGDGELSTV